MYRRTFLSSGAAFTLLPLSPAFACVTVLVENCGSDVPDVAYGGGGVDVKTFPATACFTSEIGKAITLANGRVEFVAAFVYTPDGMHYEKVKTVKLHLAHRGDQVCWSHNVAVGTWMSVWVTCRSYTGWVGGRFNGGTDTVIMQPQPSWTWQPRWL